MYYDDYTCTTAIVRAEYMYSGHNEYWPYMASHGLMFGSTQGKRFGGEAPSVSKWVWAPPGHPIMG